MVHRVLIRLASVAECILSKKTREVGAQAMEAMKKMETNFQIEFSYSL
jgi:hypothetical protein